MSAAREQRHRLMHEEIQEWQQLWRRPDPARMTKEIVAGLKRAGVKAKVGTVWTNGHAQTAPMMVEIDRCPQGHRAADEVRFVTLRLVVHDDGDLTLYDSTVCACTDESVREWLATCPECAAGTYDEERHYYGHEAGESDFLGPGGAWTAVDTAPATFIAHQFAEARRLAWAMEWTTKTADEIEEFRREFLQSLRGRGSTLLVVVGSTDDGRPVRARFTHEEYADHHVQEVHERARAILARAEAERQATRKRAREHGMTAEVGQTTVEIAPEWSAEDAAAWLDEQVDAEGEPRVAETASQRVAWEIVEPIPGRPPKRFVEAGQTLRKRRATGQ